MLLPSPGMGRRARVLVWIAATAAVLGAVGASLLLRDDWNWARSLVERAARVATARTLDLDGDRADRG